VVIRPSPGLYHAREHTIMQASIPTVEFVPLVIECPSPFTHIICI